MSDTIVVMNEGRIQQLGSPEALYLRPVNRFVAGFIGSSNFIVARLAKRSAASDRGRVTTEGGLSFGGRLTDPASAQPDSPVTVAIRPENVILTPGESRPGQPAPGWVHVPGRVIQGTYLGDQSEYRVKVEGLGDLTARRTNESVDGERRSYGPGEPVTVAWHEDSTLLLTS